MRSFYDLMGVAPTGFDPEHRFVTSWILHPALLASLRLAFSIYGFVTIFTVWGIVGSLANPIAIGMSFSYFTELSYWGINFYLLFSAIHGFVYVKHGQSWLDRWPRPLQLLHSLLYTTIIVFPFLVTGVYWGLLREPGLWNRPYTTWTNMSKHVLNSLTALLEIILPATNQPPFLHMVFLVLILALYLAVAFITHADQGWYPYSFLNNRGGRNSGMVAAVIFAILAAALVIFLIVWAVVWLRKKLTRGKAKRSKKDFSYPVPHTRSADVEMRAK